VATIVVLSSPDGGRERLLRERCGRPPAARRSRAATGPSERRPAGDRRREGVAGARRATSRCPARERRPRSPRPQHNRLEADRREPVRSSGREGGPVDERSSQCRAGRGRPTVGGGRGSCAVAQRPGRAVVHVRFDLRGPTSSSSRRGSRGRGSVPPQAAGVAGPHLGRSARC
jgi:hypothetical protein